MNTSLSLSGASFLAEMPGDHLGKSVSSAGDVNGDGYDDFLLSATSADQYAGKTYLVYGKQAGWINNDNIAGADASFLGEHSFGYAGFALAAAGDLNRDGCDDFLISAPYYGSYSSQIGKTYLFYSDTPCDADLDQDRDIDGVDLAIFSAQTVLVNLKIMASGFGSTNCSL